MTFPVRPACFSLTASRIALMDSAFADSKNPQVLITVTSDFLAVPSTENPDVANTPAISSLSTSFLAQPRVTILTLGEFGMDSNYDAADPFGIPPALNQCL